MPLTIKRLSCRVTVRTGAGKPSPLGKSERSPRPSMAFALPPGRDGGVGGESDSSPEHTATEKVGAHSTQQGIVPEAQATRADPRQVADRVYELMREEIRLQQLRGGRRW